MLDNNKTAQITFKLNTRFTVALNMTIVGRNIQSQRRTELGGISLVLAEEMKKGSVLLCRKTAE